MRAKVMGRCAAGVTGAAGVAGFVVGAAASGCVGVTGAGIVGSTGGDTVGRSASASSSTESTVVGGATALGADFIT